MTQRLTSRNRIATDETENKLWRPDTHQLKIAFIYLRSVNIKVRFHVGSETTRKEAMDVRRS